MKQMVNKRKISLSGILKATHTHIHTHTTFVITFPLLHLRLANESPLLSRSFLFNYF